MEEFLRLLELQSKMIEGKIKGKKVRKTVINPLTGLEQKVITIFAKDMQKSLPSIL